jgi:hypothetical protein
MWANPIPGLSAASALNAASNVIPLGSLSSVGGLLRWSAGVTDGEVVFEMAPTPDYAGTWTVVYRSNFVDDSQAASSVADPLTWPGPFSGFGRWRVSEAIIGGTVTTETQGNVD